MSPSKNKLRFIPRTVRWYGLFALNFLTFSNIFPGASSRRKAQLPLNFSARYYSQMNPKLGRKRYSAELHYLLYGRYRSEIWDVEVIPNPPGFHPSIYRTYWTVPAPMNAIEHFLENGQPEGLWLYPVLELSLKPQEQLPLPTALHIHVFYVELLEEILQGVSGNSSKPDIILTVVDASHIPYIRALEHKLKLRPSEVVVVQNLGRNFGPLAHLLETGVLERYEVIGHVHTKRTYEKDTPKIAHWRSFLISHLLGSDKEPRMMDKILSAFSTNGQLGMVFPDDPLELGWGSNEKVAQTLTHEFKDFQLPEHFKFPVGAMFWVRKSLLDSLPLLGLTMLAMPQEPLPFDGTRLHALERLLGIAPQYFGYEILLTRIPGVTRYLRHEKSYLYIQRLTAKN